MWHIRRSHDDHRHPVLVTLRGDRRLPSLRAEGTFPKLRRALALSNRANFRVVHFSVQTDHIHLVVEADGRKALTKGIQGLAGRCARAINRASKRHGRVWSDRYHRRPLRTPREMRAAIVYVLQNFRKHLRAPAVIDPRSSGPWFGGWARTSERHQRTHAGEPAPELARQGGLAAGRRTHPFRGSSRRAQERARRERRCEARAILIWHCLKPRKCASARRVRDVVGRPEDAIGPRRGSRVVSSAEHENAIARAPGVDEAPAHRCIRRRSDRRWSRDIDCVRSDRSSALDGLRPHVHAPRETRAGSECICPCRRRTDRKRRMSRSARHRRRAGRRARTPLLDRGFDATSCGSPSRDVVGGVEELVGAGRTDLHVLAVAPVRDAGAPRVHQAALACVYFPLIEIAGVRAPARRRSGTAVIPDWTLEDSQLRDLRRRWASVADEGVVDQGHHPEGDARPGERDAAEQSQTARGAQLPGLAS